MDYFIIIAPKLVSFFLLIALGFTISKLRIFPKSWSSATPMSLETARRRTPTGL